MNTKRIAVAGALSLAVAAAFSFRSAAAAGSDAERWGSDTVDVFAKLPVQEGGRVKPFATFAGFTLLALNGKRAIVTPSEEKLEPTGWMMDAIFFPEKAVKYDMFVVQAAEVLDAAGIEHEGKNRRDRYSYVDLEPGLQKIFELAAQYERIDAKDRDPVQGQLVNLAKNLGQFEAVVSVGATLERPRGVADSPALEKVFGKDARPHLSDLLDHAAELAPSLAGGEDPHGSMSGGGDPALVEWVEGVRRFARGIALIPPAVSVTQRAQWYSPAELAEAALYGGEKVPEETAALRDFEQMFETRKDPAAFKGHAESFAKRVTELAERRGEYAKVPLEVSFYKGDFFYRALLAFGFGFVLVAFSWLKPSKWLTRGTLLSVGAGLVLLVTGITMRCIIRSRPPVSTLYETILFITAVAVIASLVAEYVNRKGIALGMSTLLGAGGMFLANRYEIREGIDTMPSLVAVLDTNFWLATHVTCVTVGYSAGLLAGAVGHVYVLGKLLGFKRNDAAFYKTLSTMTYGMLCFGLVFSVVGTILGGIWANDSWGRFWGWDPKENGALTIVLWELIILHSRMAGFLRDFGIAMASIFGAAVVAASWWGVNLLGVGLHSYGFTQGILWSLLGFFMVEGAMLAAGGIWWMTSRQPAASPG